MWSVWDANVFHSSGIIRDDPHDPLLGAPGTTRFDQVKTVTGEVWPLEQVIEGLGNFFPGLGDMVDTGLRRDAEALAAFKASLPDPEA